MSGVPALSFTGPFAFPQSSPDDELFDSSGDELMAKTLRKRRQKLDQSMNAGLEVELIRLSGTQNIKRPKRKYLTELLTNPNQIIKPGTYVAPRSRLISKAIPVDEADILDPDYLDRSRSTLSLSSSLSRSQPCSPRPPSHRSGSSSSRPLPLSLTQALHHPPGSFGYSDRQLLSDPIAPSNTLQHNQYTLISSARSLPSESQMLAAVKRPTTVSGASRPSTALSLSRRSIPAVRSLDQRMIDHHAVENRVRVELQSVRSDIQPLIAYSGDFKSRKTGLAISAASDPLAAAEERYAAGLSNSRTAHLTKASMESRLEALSLSGLHTRGADFGTQTRVTTILNPVHPFSNNPHPHLLTANLAPGSYNPEAAFEFTRPATSQAPKMPELRGSAMAPASSTALPMAERISSILKPNYSSIDPHSPAAIISYTPHDAQHNFSMGLHSGPNATPSAGAATRTRVQRVALGPGAYPGLDSAWEYARGTQSTKLSSFDSHSSRDLLFEKQVWNSYDPTRLLDKKNRQLMKELKLEPEWVEAMATALYADEEENEKHQHHHQHHHEHSDENGRVNRHRRGSNQPIGEEQTDQEENSERHSESRRRGRARSRSIEGQEEATGNEEEKQTKESDESSSRPPLPRVLSRSSAAVSTFIRSSSLPSSSRLESRRRSIEAMLMSEQQELAASQALKAELARAPQMFEPAAGESAGENAAPAANRRRRASLQLTRDFALALSMPIDPLDLEREKQREQNEEKANEAGAAEQLGERTHAHTDSLAPATPPARSRSHSPAPSSIGSGSQRRGEYFPRKNITLVSASSPERAAVRLSEKKAERETRASAAYEKAVVVEQSRIEGILTRRLQSQLVKEYRRRNHLRSAHWLLIMALAERLQRFEHILARRRYWRSDEAKRIRAASRIQKAWRNYHTRVILARKLAAFRSLRRVTALLRFKVNIRRKAKAANLLRKFFATVLRPDYVRPIKSGPASPATATRSLDGPVSAPAAPVPAAVRNVNRNVSAVIHHYMESVLVVQRAWRNWLLAREAQLLMLYILWNRLEEQQEKLLIKQKFRFRAGLTKAIQADKNENEREKGKKRHGAADAKEEFWADFASDYSGASDGGDVSLSSRPSSGSTSHGPTSELPPLSLDVRFSPYEKRAILLQAIKKYKLQFIEARRHWEGQLRQYIQDEMQGESAARRLLASANSLHAAKARELGIDESWLNEQQFRREFAASHPPPRLRRLFTPRQMVAIINAAAKAKRAELRGIKISSELSSVFSPLGSPVVVPRAKIVQAAVASLFSPSAAHRSLSPSGSPDGSTGTSFFSGQGLLSGRQASHQRQKMFSFSLIQPEAEKQKKPVFERLYSLVKDKEKGNSAVSTGAPAPASLILDVQPAGPNSQPRVRAVPIIPASAVFSHRQALAVAASLPGAPAVQPQPPASDPRKKIQFRLDTVESTSESTKKVKRFPRKPA